MIKKYQLEGRITAQAESIFKLEEIYKNNIEKQEHMQIKINTLNDECLQKQKIISAYKEILGLIREISLKSEGSLSYSSMNSNL